ncbi:MAG TPA: protease inhibitor I42 family protein [Candidatus Baltobacteraceae bacterium]|jgi:predicted secreted protein|nr:protease inhibitor I42 family protein [Candidatus Baltobacteraceae bacterium]
MKRLAATLALLLIASATPAIALTPRSPVMIASDAAQPQTVKAGDDFFIALPSNVTTGYAWTSKVDDDKLLAYEGNVYQPPDAAMPGAGGEQIFLFHANRSGSTTVTLEYARSFETGTPAAKTLTFNITVQ